MGGVGAPKLMDGDHQCVADLFGHCDTVTIDEGEDLVIIENRVHGLNPQGVHWSIKHYPLLIWFLICT